MNTYTVLLEPQSEKLSPTNPLGIHPAPLYHQQRTYEAFQGSELVINTYNTGTGKTKAALFRLFDLDGENVLFIAPTNELIHQHAEDIRAFVERHKLRFHVLEVNGARLRQLDAGDDLDFERRNPKKLHELIRNPTAYFTDVPPKTPLILVTNPDIFYLCLYFAYSPLDSRNLFGDVLCSFDYIVIDEFHYYDAKQLACFLFFFTISQEYGYFDDERRKVCLLSATPDEQVLEYLNRIGLRWTLLSPDNEPPESDGYPSIRVLAPVELTLHAERMRKWLPGQPETIENCLRAGQDGAIISDALITINEIAQALKAAHIEDFGRITGAVPIQERRDATRRFPLVLATPTVDIGYNFVKLNKDRQNLDFLFFEARDAPAFLQRIGRAGRVLGKAQCEQPSVAHAFNAGALIHTLQTQRRKTWNRHDFAGIVRATLGQDNRFYDYLHSWALTEVFRPIYELDRATLETRRHRVQDLFGRVHQVFAPGSPVTYEALMKRMSWYRAYGDLIRAHEENSYSDYIEHLRHRAAWAYIRHDFWQKGEMDRFSELTEEQLNGIIVNLLRRRHRERILRFAQEEHALVDSLFHFRSSQYGFRCGVYDPRHLFQDTATHTVYDLWHVVQMYEYRILDRHEFWELTNGEGEWCDFYAEVTGFRQPRQHLAVEYDPKDLSQEEFERRYRGRPIAIRGLRLAVTYRRGGVEHPGYLEPEIAEALLKQPVTCLIVGFQNRYVFQQFIAARLVPLPLKVRFAGGPQDYQMVLGPNAFLVHAELRRRWEEGQHELKEVDSLEGAPEGKAEERKG